MEVAHRHLLCAEAWSLFMDREVLHSRRMFCGLEQQPSLVDLLSMVSPPSLWHLHTSRIDLDGCWVSASVVRADHLMLYNQGVHNEDMCQETS